MMNFETWQIINESIQGGVTLGLGRPHTVAGPIGSSYMAEDFGKDEDDEDEDKDDEEYDGEQTGGKEGDLVGSSSEDEGPDKNWPPDTEEEENGLPTPDEEMMGGDEGGDDFLASLGAGAGGKDVGPEAGAAPEVGDDMGFLGDINPDLLGGEPEAGMDPDMGAEMGGDVAPDMGGDVPPEVAGMEPEGGAEAGEAGAPCPECNADGSQEIGDPDCPSCGGVGFLDDGGEEFGPELTGAAPADAAGDADMNAFMDKMAMYMAKHMKKEWAQLKEFAPAVAPAVAGSAVSPTQPMPMQQPMQQPMQPAIPSPRRQISFMSKRGMRKFMAAESPKKFMKKDDDKKCCPCESQDDFLNSLCGQAKNTANTKWSSGLSEDALFQLDDPNADHDQGPQAGQVGFAPQGRVGSIGGGYTQDDIKDIPVMGESRRYPTLAEYAAMKARKKAAKTR